MISLPLLEFSEMIYKISPTQRNRIIVYSTWIAIGAITKRIKITCTKRFARVLRYFEIYWGTIYTSVGWTPVFSQRRRNEKTYALNEHWKTWEKFQFSKLIEKFTKIRSTFSKISKRMIYEQFEIFWMKNFPPEK